MIILKEFEVAIDVSNCIMFYANENSMITRLRMDYKGKCHGGALIKDITRIIAEGNCVITQDTTPSFGTVSVKFEALVEVYSPGEIINGVEITGIQQTSIVCSAPRLSIVMSMNNRLRSLQKGQIISVRVGLARYTKGEPKVAINALPLLPSPEYNIYRVLPPRDLSILDDVKKRIEAEEAGKKAGGAAWAVFDKMLDAYTKPQQPAGEIRPINDVVTLTSGYVCRDPMLGSDPSIVVYDERPKDEHAKLVPVGTLDEAAVAIMEDYVGRLRTAREMASIYSSEKMITSHNNLWKIFKSVKL